MSATITLKNIPDDIYTRLKEVAQAHHRSLNSEIIACLESMLLPTRIMPNERLERARLLRKNLILSNFDPKEIDDAIEQGRP
jgi:plasmid stability protein